MATQLIKAYRMKVPTTIYLDIPRYLNEEFFRETLANGLQQSKLIINNVKFAQTSGGGGENYCSQIYRAKVDYQRSLTKPMESINLIIKSIPDSPEMQFLEEQGVFDKEKTFYFDILRRLEILVDGTKFAASCYGATKDPLQTIVFNDLTPLGYTLASRQKGLDEEHCKILLRKLGQFHAASMVLAKADPSVVDYFQAGMLDANSVNGNDHFDLVTGGQLRTLASIVSNWSGFEKISEKLLKYEANLKENVIKAGAPRDDEIKVLNHGDLWVNNFMYKYDSQNLEKPIDVIFVDFQTSFYGSPGCDLNFFLNSSVQLDVLIHKREILIETYYESFSETLRKLKFDSNEIPTLNDIHRELRQREHYGLFSAFSFLPMVAMHKEDSKDNSIAALCDETFAKKKIALMFNSNIRTLDTLRHTLQRFDQLGVLDEY